MGISQYILAQKGILKAQGVLKSNRQKGANGSLSDLNPLDYK